MTNLSVDKKLNEIDKLNESKKVIDERIEMLKEQIKKSMEDKEYKETNKYQIHFTTVISNRFDTEKFKEEHEKMYERYCRKSTTRRFTYKRK